MEYPELQGPMGSLSPTLVRLNNFYVCFFWFRFRKSTKELLWDSLYVGMEGEQLAQQWMKGLKGKKKGKVFKAK